MEFEQGKDYYLEDKEGGGFNKINYYYNGPSFFLHC